MKTLVIINLVCNILIIAWLISKANRFYIEVNKTCWMKKVTSISLMYVYQKDRYGNRQTAKPIITLRLRNWYKWQEWDSECFHNGTYTAKLNKKREPSTTKGK
jgi:hypothetical protein